MKLLFSLILLVVLCGCRKVFYYNSLNPATRPLRNAQSLQLDNSYKFFVRQVYETTTGDSRELRSNTARGANQSLIEVEYLFISQQKKKVLYISTMPDKYKQRYRKYYLGNQYVNAWDFKTFLFGCIQSNGGIKFTDWEDKASDTWRIEYRKDSSEVYITDVIEKIGEVFYNQIPVSEALKNEVFFFNVADPLLVFHQNDTKEDTASLVNNTIFLRKRRGRYSLYLEFDRKVNDKYSTIRFGESRLIYDPRPVFTGNCLKPR